MSAAQESFDRFQPGTAWEAYYPNATNPWDAAKVAHLYRRAAFGASHAQLAAGVDSTPDKVVTRLLEGGPEFAAFERDAARLEAGALDSGEPQQLQAAWMYRLLYSPYPLAERMTLFWHNHFATSNAKVKSVRLMHAQHEIFRRHALGHFGEMLQEITRDPAMLVWLDSNTNKKGQPNENYAREVFELFSLDVGNYTEEDIGEAARALTGWQVQDGRAYFDPQLHDDETKTILGQTGPWGAGDVVRIALAQPACARFLVRKLFRELVSDAVEPSDEMLSPLADGFHLRNYDVGWLVDRMLRSWVFYSPAAMGQKVKSPVDFVVGTVRMLGGRFSLVAAAEACDQLGQNLFYPPSVKGWDGGGVWLNSTTLLNRQNLAFEMTRGTEKGQRCDPANVARKHGVTGDEHLAEFWLRLLLADGDHPARSEIVAHLSQRRKELENGFYSPSAVEAQLARTAAHLVMTLPEYQLS